MRANLSAFLMVLLSILTAPASAAVPAIYNLGTITPEGAESGGTAINNSGQVVGYSLTPPDLYYGDCYAFLYTGTPGSGGVMHDLGTLGETGSSGTGINDSGQVVGAIFPRPRFEAYEPLRAFLYTGTPGSGGIMHELGTLGGVNSYATAINTSGQLTGASSMIGAFPIHAFLYTGLPGVDGQMVDLGTLGGVDSEGTAINDHGQVTGWSRADDLTSIHAFLYSGTPGNGGTMHDLGTLGGINSRGQAINAAGHVVGSSEINFTNDPDDYEVHAFLYTGKPGNGGTMHDLGTLGGRYASAWDINASGLVVGQSDTAGNIARHAFLYSGTPGVDGIMIDLEAWLDANNPLEGAKWRLSSARALNDRGLITGYGEYDDGPGGLSDGTRAFLLDASSLLVVVPEPGTLALLTLTVPALLRRRRSRHT